MATREDESSGAAPRGPAAATPCWPPRETVAHALAQRADEHDRDGTFPFEGIDAIWRAGLGNLTLPRRARRRRLRPARRRPRRSRCSRPAMPRRRSSWSCTWSHAPLLAQPGSGLPGARARAAFVESTLAGPALANALRVEPELGSPARGGVPATRARSRRRRDGSQRWSVSGRKIFSTGAPGLRWLLVWGATADDDPDGVRIGWFLVPGDAPGVSIEETWDHLGMRGLGEPRRRARRRARSRSTTPSALHAPGERARAAATRATVGAMLVLLLSVYLGVAAGGARLARRLPARARARRTSARRSRRCPASSRPSARSSRGSARAAPDRRASRGPRRRRRARPRVPPPRRRSSRSP